MPFVPRPFTLEQWASRMLCWSTPHGLLVTSRVQREVARQSLSAPQQHDEEAEGSMTSIDEGDVCAQHVQDAQCPLFPLVSEQIDQQVKDFIASIDKGAVCRLASQHNGQKPCSITGQNNGSFNVCFFTRFDDGTTWVVRIPLEPVVKDSWLKVQSEVTTMRFVQRGSDAASESPDAIDVCRYIKLKTTIPIPRVHAYGQNTQLTKSGGPSTTTFMISDFIPGRNLRFDHVHDASEERRTQFLGELVDILVQLRRLEFPAAGSLMPNPVDESEPIVGGFLGMAINELQRDTGEKKSPLSFSSAEAFVDYQFSILSEYYAVPFANLQQTSVEEHLFVLDSLAEQIPQLLNPQWSNGPFVLSHLDLRCGNILVDQDLHILGIIDWEFTGAVPLQYYTPPPWITGEARSGVFLSFQDPVFQSFEAVLRAKSTASESCAQLVQEWNWNNQQKLMFPIVQILREPDSLVHVYRRFLCLRLSGGNLKEAASHFFAHHERAKELASVVNRQVEASKRYTQYLDDHGLLDIDQEEREAEERLAFIKEGMAKLKGGNTVNAVT